MNKTAINKGLAKNEKVKKCSVKNEIRISLKGENYELLMITTLTETPATNQLTGEKYFCSLYPDQKNIPLSFTTSIFAFKSILPGIQLLNLTRYPVIL